ncbi:type II secretion system ATPase GspE [bacterium]|nr:type II secretion system ATPase GspE [bacterium]
MISSDGNYLVQVLTRAGVISEEQAKTAEEVAGQRRVPVTTAVKELGYADGNRISQVLAEHFGLRSVDLATVNIDKEVLTLVPHSVARRYKTVPLEMRDNTLVVAISDPLNLDSVDSLRMLVKMNVEPVIADAEDIQKSIERHYGAEEEAVAKMLEEISSGDIRYVQDDGRALTSEEEEEETAEEAPVIKLVSLLIMEAFRHRASDIHLEPLGRKFRVRYRIDGVCHEVQGPPRRLQGSVLSRVKIMAGMDIAEKRLPQDGRILIKVLGREIDLRVSVLPGNHGESIVMRILDKESLLLGLAELGFSSDDQKTYEKLIQLPHGVLLITGPTGSGKTTTLYACLNYINRPDRKIITVEDPIEYMLSGINQVHVKEDIGLTFAAALRSMLRQAPNVIMVGEIRDLETAEIAVNASLTGHLVFSTLHTNDAPGAFTRLIDMGVKPFLVASALQSVMAQRLVRKICPECTQPYDPPSHELEAMGLTHDDVKGANLRKGAGCSSCNNTGHRGRIGIFELMTVNEDIQKLVYQCVPATEIRKVARQYGMKTLREDGMLKVLGGVSTFDEVMRITQKDVD